MTQFPAFRTMSLVTAIAAAGLALSACGSSDSGAGSAGAAPSAGAMAGMPGMSASSDASATSNDADVAFVQMMIPDHQMTVKMSKLAAQKAAGADLRALATQMQKGQTKTVSMMKGMLKDWGSTASADPAGMSMPGAMTAKDMTELKAMKGMDFDMMFAQMMVKHHQASITMAEQEQAKGVNADAKSMAADMVTEEQAQVAKLRKIAQM
jgi:uncharacterized protein (DUF305 family)